MAKELVTILILIDGFLQYKQQISKKEDKQVTILILVDGFLQFRAMVFYGASHYGHNPYFSRWFSAIIHRKPYRSDTKESQSLF